MSEQFDSKLEKAQSRWLDKYGQQEVINYTIACEWRYFNQWKQLKRIEENWTKRLNNCQAWVTEYYDTETGEIMHELTSYETVVAHISGSTCFDYHKMVYDFESSYHTDTTTVQQICKFMKQYGGNNCNRIVWKPIPEYPR